MIYVLRWTFDRLHYFILLGLVLGLFALALTGCAAAPGNAETVGKVWDSITADGTITPTEAAQFRAALDAALGSGEALPTWLDRVLTIGGAVVTSFLGVNVYRNRTRAAALAAVSPSSDPVAVARVQP